MDIEINNRTEAALFRNGKYEYTFTPTKKNEQIKLHHMGCNGSTKISNLQLERGTDVTFFERPYEKANSLSGIFKQLRDLDIEMRDETSEFWGRLKLNNKGMLTEFKETELNTILATTAEGISTQVNRNINDAVASFNQKYNEIAASVSTFENDVLKKNEISITNDGITLGAGKVIDGRNLTTMLVTNPENIQAITNRMIITPSYDNLVHFDKRYSFTFFDEYIQITSKIENDLKEGDRFLFKFDVSYIGGLAVTLELIMKIETASNQEKSYAFQLIPSGKMITEQSSYNITLNTDAILEEFSDIRSYTFYLRQATKYNFTRMDIKNLQLMKQKDAELLVEGSIRGRHIAGETITGGNIQAGTIDSVNIKSNAITADHLKVDNAMVNKLLVNDAFINNLVAKDAFIKNLKSVKISANQLETDFLRSYKGYIGGFQIGKHDKDGQSSWWLTGTNQFYVGMSNGSGTWGQTALWVNWGTSWDKVGKYAWYVKENGEMYCKNTAYFWNTPTVIGDLKVTGNIFFNDGRGNSGKWLYSHNYERIENKSGYVYFYYPWGSYDWVDANKEISDRRYKRNIKESEVNALEVLNKLNTYSYTKEYDGNVKDISCGIMAQEVEEHLPDAFKQLPDDIKSYGAFELVPYLIKGIQELSKQNDKLQKEMEILKHGK